MRGQILGLVFCIAAFAMSAAAQTNTFPASGPVGIGTPSPLAELHVNNGTNRDLLIGTDAVQLGTTGMFLGSFNMEQPPMHLFPLLARRSYCMAATSASGQRALSHSSKFRIQAERQNPFRHRIATL
jgi:hypothetical protein